MEREKASAADVAEQEELKEWFSVIEHVANVVALVSYTVVCV